MILYGNITPASYPDSIIESIQAFSITIGTGATSNTATITSVNTSYSMIVWGGMQNTNSAALPVRTTEARVTLTNSTTVTATRNTSDATYTSTVKGFVVQFKSSVIQSIQSGTITIAGTSNTATISSVTTTNALCHFQGQTGTSSIDGTTRGRANVVLTNATTVTAARITATDSCTVGYTVVEFKSGVLNSSTQQFSITVSAGNSSSTAAISSVATGQSAIFYGGAKVSTSGGVVPTELMGKVVLTNATTVTASRSATTASFTVTGTVVEFKAENLSRIQRGTIDLNGVATNTATITSVNTAKSFVSFLGASTTDSTASADQMYSSVVLTNATTVTADTVAAPSTLTASYEAINFT